MIKLYHKLDIPNFEDIRLQILNNLPGPVEEKWKPESDWLEKSASLLKEYLDKNAKFPINFFKFYIIKGNGRIPVHVDGFHTNPYRVGLLIPITDTEGCKMTWYNSPEDNYLPPRMELTQITKLKNLSLLTEIESIIVDKPTLVRSDVPHGAINLISTTHALLNVRFQFNDITNDFSDVLKNIE